MAQSAIQPWHFSGDFFESCNCEVNCPCVFGTPAHYDRCDVALAWHVASGRYGDTTLDGLNFVVVADPKADGRWQLGRGHLRRPAGHQGPTAGPGAYRLG